MPRTESLRTVMWTGASDHLAPGGEKGASVRTMTLERAQVLHLKAGDILPGDEVVYLLHTANGGTHHVATWTEAVSFSNHRTWITLSGSEGTCHLPVGHPVVVVRGLLPYWSPQDR